MKLYQINNACKAVEQLLKLRLPYPKIHQIMKLRDKMRSESEMYAQEEEKLIYEYGKKSENGTPEIANGFIKFDSVAQMEAFKGNIEQLKNLEIDFIPTVIKISDQEMGQQQITIECIDRLSKFVEFGGD